MTLEKELIINSTTDLKSLKKTARQAGLIYFLFSIIAVIGEFFFPAFLVSGDTAATANNISSNQFLYRTEILTGFITNIMFIILVVWLYNLFKEVNRKQAMLMLILVIVGISAALANLFNKVAPLVILSGTDYLSVFTKDQTDALITGFLRFHSKCSVIVTIFWGLWLFPFGFLVIKSGFIPKLFGILLWVAGLAYFIGSITALVSPLLRQVISPFLMPLYFGEIPIIFWLLLKGIKEPKQN